VATAGVALVLLIGFSRLYFGVHYLTDILAGFLAAPLWTLVGKYETA
jgi:undecaprenyl-diphosphatase